MGMPAPLPPITTIDELLALPDDGLRHELLDGMHVVTPAPRPLHQAAVAELIVELSRFVVRDACQLLPAPADIVLGPKTLVQPDLFVVRLPAGKALDRWEQAGVPVIAIEILSPATAPRDRGAKRRIYQRAGVAQYWIVDLDARLVERWLPDDERPEVLHRTLGFDLPGCATGSVDLHALFERLTPPLPPQPR